MLNEMNKMLTKNLWEKLESCFIDEVAEDFIEILLKLMSTVFLLDYGYRKNIQNFRGNYLFKSSDGAITVSAIFQNSTMKVMEQEIPDPDITVIFSNGKALFSFIFSPNQNILQSMLNNELTTRGNLNYIYRFGFLAKKLQLLMTGK